jgi:hypothetical protein
MITNRSLILAGASLALLAAPVCAAVIYETTDPFGSPFGLIGFDISSKQSIGVRFTPDDLHRLQSIGVWFMNNDFSGATHPLVVLTLRTDDSSGRESIPSDEIIESWTFNVSAVGWDPMLETVESRLAPLLQQGVNYWIVAESEAPGGDDGVWNWAGASLGFTAICNGDPCEWFSGDGAVAATVVQGTLAADLNFDGHVDGFDLGLLLGGWGSCVVVDPCLADLNGDGVVNGFDLGLLLGAWTG